MLVIIDHRLPDSAKDILRSSVSKSGEPVILLELHTEGITECAVSGHPAVFFCPMPDTMVVAPDLPEPFFRMLDRYGVRYIRGNTEAGQILKQQNGRTVKGQQNTAYNALITPEFLIHDLAQTDPVILQHAHYLKKIPVKQAFTRSHLVHLTGEHYITSDKGIEKALQERGLDVLFVDPGPILLPGYANGGIGGASGIAGHCFFINGCLRFHPQELQVRKFLEELSFRIIELGDYPPVDVGGMAFVSKKLEVQS